MSDDAPDVPGADAAWLDALTPAQAEAVRTLQREASLADRRAKAAEALVARLGLLQDATRGLSRSLESRDIVAELGKQVSRLLRVETVSVLSVDLDLRTVVTEWRQLGNTPRPRHVSPLVEGPLEDAVRAGRSRRAAGDGTALLAEQLCLDDLRLDGRIASAVIVPMIAAKRLEGVLVVSSMLADAFLPVDLEVAATMAAQGAAALRNARLYAESEQERRRSEALSAVASAVGESLRLGEVQHLILRHAMALLRSEGAALAMLEGRYLHVVAGVGSNQVLAGMHLPVEGSVAGQVVRTGEYRIVNNVIGRDDVYRPTLRLASIRKVVIVPLITASGPIGVLTANDRDAEFTDEDARVLQRLADQVAVAIVNARLFEEARQATQEWRVLFDAVPSGVVVLDEDGRIARFNARALQLTGTGDGRTLIGQWFTEAVLGLDVQAPLPAAVVRALQDGAVARETVPAPARGQVFDLLASPHPDGGAVVTFEDVTGVHALEARYRTVVETATDAIIITDTARHIAFANRTAHELLGRQEEMVGHPIAQFVERSQQELVAAMQGLAMQGEAQRFETAVVRADGDVRTVSVSTGALREASGTVGTVSSLRDITDERRARDAIAQSEQRYRNLFGHASDAIYTLDLRGVMTSANEAASVLCGVPVAELVGRSIAPFIAEEDAPMVQARFRSAIHGTAERFESRMRRADGTVRLLSVTNTPIRERDVVQGVLGIARDITEERARAEALARSEASYVRLVEAASDAIFTVDEAGTLTSVNRVLERTMGVSREQLLGQPFTVLLEQSPDRETLWRVFADTLHGARERTEFRYRDARGDVRTASLLTTPVSMGDKVTGVLAVVRDITDERRLQEQLLLQEKLAAIGQLVSGVAHELNNPLAGVLAHAQLLLASPGLAEDHRSAVDAIHHDGRRAARIVGNLLTFARRHRPERTLADVGEVITDSLALRRYPLAVAGIALDTDVAQGLPFTWADPFQLQQVVLNLLTNAEHALSDEASDRRVRVRAAVEGEWIVFEVGDNGPGMPPDVADRVFNPFYTTKPVGRGTGLGLSIADGIVREHGGRIVLTTAPGRGANFRVEIPIAQMPDDYLTAVPRPSNPRPRAVLVADPDSATRHIAARFLAEAGFSVDTFATAADTRDAIGARRWDAVLLDVALPSDGGLALYAHICERDPVLAAHVVFTSADDPDAALRAALEATGRPWVTKPYDVPSLPTLLFDEIPA